MKTKELSNFCNHLTTIKYAIQSHSESHVLNNLPRLPQRNPIPRTKRKPQVIQHYPHHHIKVCFCMLVLLLPPGNSALVLFNSWLVLLYHKIFTYHLHKILVLCSSSGSSSLLGMFGSSMAGCFPCHCPVPRKMPGTVEVPGWSRGGGQEYASWVSFILTI